MIIIPIPDRIPTLGLGLGQYGLKKLTKNPELPLVTVSDISFSSG